MIRIISENDRVFVNNIIEGETYHTVSFVEDDINKIAMHSPLVKRMVEYIKNDDYAKDWKCDIGTYCRICDAGDGCGCRDDCPRKILLADIAELESEE